VKGARSHVPDIIWGLGRLQSLTQGGTLVDSTKWAWL
jgi:hypothetical protein